MFYFMSDLEAIPEESMKANNLMHRLMWPSSPSYPIALGARDSKIT
jgi:hypothetical protein